MRVKLATVTGDGNDEHDGYLSAVCRPYLAAVCRPYLKL